MFDLLPFVPFIILLVFISAQIIIRRLSEFRDSGRRRLFPARGAANIVDIVIAYVSAVTVASLVFSFGSAVVEFMTGLWGGDELESLSRRNYSDYIVFTVIIWFILLQIAFPFVALASLFYVPQGKWGLGVCVVAGGLVSIIIYKVMFDSTIDTIPYKHLAASGSLGGATYWCVRRLLVGPPSPNQGNAPSTL